MKNDIKEIFFSEEQLAEKVKEFSRCTEGCGCILHRFG